MKTTLMVAQIETWDAGQWVRYSLLAVLAAGALALVIVGLRRNWHRKTAQFLSEVKGELYKSAWPTWSNLWDSTVVIIVSTLALSLFIGVADVVLQTVVRFVIR